MSNQAQKEMCNSEAGTKILLLGGHTDNPRADEVFIDLSSACAVPNDTDLGLPNVEPRR